MQKEDFLDFSNADYPLGKEITIGPQRALIYERAIEDGYQAGVRACAEMGLRDGSAVNLLTDKGYTEILDKSTPEGLTSRDRDTWRAYFITGWVWVCLATPSSVNFDSANKKQC